MSPGPASRDLDDESAGLPDGADLRAHGFRVVNGADDARACPSGRARDEDHVEPEWGVVHPEGLNLERLEDEALGRLEGDLFEPLEAIDA